MNVIRSELRLAGHAETEPAFSPQRIFLPVVNPSASLSGKLKSIA
ncbi:MAG: hypothetical protein PHI84_16770 [Kiritimatiellae bacterium]|nr:hypothetical protein [Kiritimatiellia bacterium]